MEQTKVILGSGKDQSVRRFHPWIFSGAIKKIKGIVAEGDLVSVYDNKDELLGFGHYAEGSIAVRMIGFGNREPDDHYISERIKKAWLYRTGQLGLLRADNNVFRLVFAEGDLLPGLILDYYDGHIVMQCHSYGMYLERERITEALKQALGTRLKSVYDKSAETLHYREAGAINSPMLGEDKGTIVTENEFRFSINWETGQKTGFFIDQRENRVALRKFCEGKSVLNTFCYSGGFSVYAMGSGAKRVVSVDSSGKAMDLCRENMNLNFPDDPRHAGLCTDVFDYLEQSEETFDIIILDPPAFAKHMNVRHKAVQGYKRLNQTAIRKLNPGGILLTFSCSQAVEKNLFFSTVTSAAILCGRQARFLEYLNQPADHGYSIFHPEGEYLKGIALHID
jgi:23S rRNA (cytosine1962-C5)-methyltransferase